MIVLHEFFSIRNNPPRLTNLVPSNKTRLRQAMVGKFKTLNKKSKITKLINNSDIKSNII